MSKANHTKAVLAFVVILSVSIVHSAQPDVRHDKIRRAERRSRLEEQVGPQLLPAKIPTDLLTNRSKGSANPVRRVPSHPKARLNPSITGKHTPNNPVHNAKIAPPQKETREAPQKVENNISSEPKLSDVRESSLKVSANDKTAVKGVSPHEADTSNIYDNTTSSGIVKEGNEKPDEEKVVSIAKDTLLEESQMNERNLNPETDLELNALTSTVAVPIDALNEDEVDDSLENSPNLEIEDNPSEMLAFDVNEKSTDLKNLSAPKTEKPTTKPRRQKQVNKPNVSQAPKKSAAPVNKKLISPLAVSSRLPSKSKTESKTEKPDLTTLENNSKEIADEKDYEKEMSSEEKFPAEENESDKKSKTDDLLSEDDKSDAGSSALDSKTSVDSITSDDNSDSDEFSTTRNVVTERISLHKKPINQEAFRKGGVPKQSPATQVTQNTGLKLPNSGHPKLQKEHSSHPKVRGKPSTFSPTTIENKPNPSTPSVTKTLSPSEEKHNIHADINQEEINQEDTVINKETSGLETENNSKNKTPKQSPNKSDSKVEKKSSINTIKDKTAPKTHEDSPVNPVKAPSGKLVDKSVGNTAQDTSSKHMKTEVNNSKNTHTKKESGHHKAKVSSSAPKTKHKVASAAVVIVAMFLLAFVTFLTILGVYFNKISFSRRSHWQHMPLSTEEDDLPLFNRQTHYDDYDPPYESWKHLT